INTAALIIDGKESHRVGPPFRGAQGLPPMGEWDGCFTLDSYDPMITPGNHKVALRMNGIQSEPIKVHWNAPTNWKQGNMKSRLKEIEPRALAIQDGLPQSCAEIWLTRKDGGQQETDKIRYFLEPQFKVVVPYRAAYEQTGMRSLVDGTPVIYAEQ